MASNSELNEYRKLVDKYHAKKRAEDLAAAGESEIKLNSQLSLDQGLAGREVSQNTQIAKSGPDSEKSSEVIDDRK